MASLSSLGGLSLPISYCHPRHQQHHHHQPTLDIPSYRKQMWKFLSFFRCTSTSWFQASSCSKRQVGKRSRRWSIWEDYNIYCWYCLHPFPAAMGKSTPQRIVAHVIRWADTNFLSISDTPSSLSFDNLLTVIQTTRWRCPISKTLCQFSFDGVLQYDSHIFWKFWAFPFT